MFLLNCCECSRRIFCLSLSLPIVLTSLTILCRKRRIRKKIEAFLFGLMLTKFLSTCLLDTLKQHPKSKCFEFWVELRLSLV